MPTAAHTALTQHLAGDAPAPRRVPSRRSDLRAQQGLWRRRCRGGGAGRRHGGVRPWPPDRDHGSVRLREVHAHALHGGSGRAHRWASGHRRSRHQPPKDKALTRLRRDRLGFVFQAYNLVPTLTARENITLPMDIAGRKVDAAWFDVVVDTLGIRDRLSHRPDELSGGQQQRVACARALLGKPAIVFADEPTGNLDSHASAEILAFLRASVDDFGQTILMVTHDPTAATYADRVVFLADGRIVDDLHHPTLEGVLERVQRLAQTGPVA